MPAKLPHRCLPLLALAALVTAFWACDACRAAGKPAPEKKAVKEAKKAAKAGKFSKEAEVLMQAYVLLATADADYAGHKGKAMFAIREAHKLLAGAVMHEGTLQQKIKAKQAAQAAGQAKSAAKQKGGHREGQAASDAQLQEAAAMLGQILPSLASHKGKKPLEHTKNAIKEIGIALKVR